MRFDFAFENTFCQRARLGGGKIARPLARARTRTQSKHITDLSPMISPSFTPSPAGVKTGLGSVLNFGTDLLGRGSGSAY